MASAPSAGRLAGRRARTRAALCGGPLALAAASLAIPAAPTYDPWSWLVFGREIVASDPGFSTISRTGWKPLAVLFTAPLALLGGAAPSLWLVLVRCVGLAAMALAFRLAARAGGAASPGCSRSSRSSPAPSGCAICRRATSSRWSWPSCSVRSSCTSVAAAAGRVPPVCAGGAGAARGVGRSSAAYATYVLLSERRWWPLALRRPMHVRAVDRARLARLGRSSSTPSTWLGSAPRPRSLQGSGDPALEAGCAAPAAWRPLPVWIGALCALGLRLAPPRSHRGGARPGRRGRGRCPPVAGGRAGLPGGAALPRRSGRPSPACSPGMGFVGRHTAGVRSARPCARWRRPCVAVSAPFAVSRANGLEHQAGGRGEGSVRSGSRRCGGRRRPGPATRSPSRGCIR